MKLVSVSVMCSLWHQISWSCGSDFIFFSMFYILDTGVVTVIIFILHSPLRPSLAFKCIFMFIAKNFLITLSILCFYNVHKYALSIPFEGRYWAKRGKTGILETVALKFSPPGGPKLGCPVMSSKYFLCYHVKSVTSR